MHKNENGSKFHRRIFVIKAIVVSFFIMTIILIGLSIAIFKTLRTFARGESFWSKSQISSNYSLSLYVTTRDEKFYNQFLNHVKIIEADGAGLSELLAKKKVTPTVLDHFEIGKNDRRDLNIALRVFLFFSDTELVQGRIREWTRGNQLIKELKQIAESVHQDYSNKKFYSQQEIEDLVKKIHDSHQLLLIHESNFSKPVIDFARFSENLLGVLQFSLFICFTLLVLLVDYSTAQIFRRTLNAIKSSIKDAVSGNLDTMIHIPVDEDIAGISGHLNLMYQSFKEQLSGRLSAEESEARLIILADTMPQIVCIYDRKYQVEFLNKVGREYLGICASSVKNFAIIDYCHPDDRASASSNILEGTIKKSPIELEVRLKNTDGEYNWFLCRFQPILDDELEINRWYGSLTNIQAQKNHSMELENSIHIRDQFLSIASHELKTPLTALKLQTGMRQRLIDKKMVESIDMVYFQKIVRDDKKQIDRIIRLVDDMLDITRIKSGKLSFNFSELEVNNFMTDVLQRFVPEFNERNCQLTFNSIPSTICYWDHHRIEQVMINLLSNALKYGQNKDVEVKLEKDSDSIKIYVQDQGEGISQRDQKKIFDLFERANHDHSISGLGLGLFIVKQIVQSHQGTIDVVSSKEQGSTFIVTLPTKIEA